MPPLTSDIVPEKAPVMLLAALLLIVTVSTEYTSELILTAPPVRVTAELQPLFAGPVPVTLIVPVPALAVKLVGDYQTLTLPSETLRLIVPFAAEVSSVSVFPLAARTPISPLKVIVDPVSVLASPTSSIPV